MKPWPVLLLLSGLVLTGCASLSDATASIRQKLAPREQPHVRVFAAGSRATYEAARIAVDQINFRFVRGGPAQGELEAISSVDSSGALRDARQIAMTVRFLPAAEEGSTEVHLWLREIVEDHSSQSAGRVSERPLPDSALYEAYFRNIQQVLAPPKRG